MGNITLRRYTNLAATLYLLRNKRITLLSPSTWDDRNDAFFMSEFKKQKEALSVLALCFAEASETYHHWRVFSHGSDGVCLEFDSASLLAAFRGDPLIQSRNVSYRKIDDAINAGIPTDDLPFCKRLPYEDEREFRIVYVDMKKEYQFKDVPISLDCIKRMMLSPGCQIP
jgi:hypothetical protein